MFGELCGESTLKNTILVANVWGDVSLDVGLGEARGEDLFGEFFKPILNSGTHHSHHYDDVGEAEAPG